MSGRQLTSAVRCWLAGGDTMDIARECGVSERMAYANLERIKNRARLFREAEEIG